MRASSSAFPTHHSFRQYSLSVSDNVTMLLPKVIVFVSASLISVQAICKESDHFVVECQLWEDVLKLPEKSSVSQLGVKNWTESVICDDSTLREFTNLTVYNVHHGGFTEIQKECFRGLRNVEIMENKVTSVALDSLNGTIVERLWLDGNKLKELSFQGIKLPVLRSLGLSANYLEHFEIETENVPDLRILDVSFNNLTKVSVESVSLSFLKLQSNLLTELSAENVRGKSIRMLYLSENKLTEIKGSLFDNVPGVEYVHLEKNPVKLIDFSLFNLTGILCTDQMIRLEKKSRQVALKVDVSWDLVQQLILNDNSVSRLDVFNFSAPQAIAELQVRHNLIREIKRDDLKLLPGLIALDLSDNRISSIEDGAFEGLKKLHSLSLAGNCIHGLSDHMFLHLNSLFTIDLSRNIMTYFVVSGWNPANNSISLTQYHVRLIWDFSRVARN